MFWSNNKLLQAHSLNISILVFFLASCSYYPYPLVALKILKINIVFCTNFDLHIVFEVYKTEKNKHLWSIVELSFFRTMKYNEETVMCQTYDQDWKYDNDHKMDTWRL